MRYYLARYIGTGGVLNPFRPATVALDEAGWSAIDLRPDATVDTGYCILASPTVRAASLLLDDLGDDLDDTGVATRLVLESKLGVAFDDSIIAARRLRRRIRTILTDFARTDGTRWRPLRPERDAWRIRLGGSVIDEVPVVAGGATITDVFTRANADALGTSAEGWSWTEVVGDIDLAVNKARTQAAGAGTVLNSARAESDLAGTDHYAKADVTFADANSSRAGVCTRFASAAETYYRHTSNPATDLDEIFKVVTGTGTSLTSQAHTLGAETVNIRGDANGSSISMVSGAAGTLSVTDTSITTGTRTGITGITTTNISRLHDIDNFEAGDLAVATTWRDRTVPRGLLRGMRAVS